MPHRAVSSHQVVCQACSSNKYCLEYLKNQTARVCDHCFLILHYKSKSGLFTVRTLIPVFIQHTFHISVPSGEQALSAAVSPGNKATLAFSRKQKKIPAALKEVTDQSSPEAATL